MQSKLKKYINNSRIRYDYFLVWGHANKYIEDIIRIINNTGFLKIKFIIKHIPNNIVDLINAVYSFDYAPVEHLKEKSKYLLKNGNKPVFFIIVENNDVNERYVDSGDFRHIECLNIKRIKNEIRDIFNERLENRRSENHVVHASDNELQTHYILKYLGFNEGKALLINHSNKLIGSPSYIEKFNSFEVRKVKIDNLLFNKNVGEHIKECKLEDMPQYKALLKDASFQKGCINFKNHDEMPLDIVKDLITECAAIDLLAIREKYLAGKAKKA